MTPDNPPFTPRNVAKFAVRATVQLKVAALSRTAIANHTPLETTDTPVVIAGGIVGWWVADKVKPITDSAVDTTADFIVAKRQKRQDKKSKKTTETE